MEAVREKLMERLSVTSRRLQMVVLALVALTPVAVGLNVVLGTWADFLHMPADIAIDVAAMVQKALTGPVLTAFRITEGHISLTLEVAFLTVGLFIVLVARVMDLGRELKEQDSLVI